MTLPINAAAVSRTWLAPCAAATLLAAQASLLVWLAARHAPALDEPHHISAGVRQWTTGQTHLDIGNPPLVKLIAGLPPVLMGAKREWTVQPTQFGTGPAFANANGARTVELVFWARCACIPFCTAAGWLCFVWARKLYGDRAGLFATALWCLHPDVLANGARVSGDVAAAACGLWAFYAFWRWRERPGLGRALAFGLALGGAQLAKFVWTSMALSLPLICLVVSASPAGEACRRPRWLAVRDAAAMVLAFLPVLNVGYGFRDFMKPVFADKMTRPALRSVVATLDRYTPGDGVRLPLPRDYVLGLDAVATDVESAYRVTYHSGAGSLLRAMLPLSVLARTPVGVIAFAGLALVWALRGATANPLPRGATAFFAFFVTLGFICAAKGAYFNRYVLPTLPLAAVSIAVIASDSAWRWAIVRWVVYAGLLASVVEVAPWAANPAGFVNLPARLAFDERYVLHPRTADEGQDLLLLEKWLQAHPEARPLHLAYSGVMDPHVLGIEYELPPGSASREQVGTWPGAKDGPRPGWHAVSKRLVWGERGTNIADGRGKPVSTAGGDFDYFRQLEPVAQIGSSIFVYRLALEEANDLRQELGYPLSKD